MLCKMIHTSTTSVEIMSMMDDVTMSRPGLIVVGRGQKGVGVEEQQSTVSSQQCTESPGSRMVASPHATE